MQNTALAHDCVPASDSSRVARTMAEQMQPLIGESAWAQGIWSAIEEQAEARHVTTVVGPSGAGKSLVAKYIHWSSDQAANPVVAVDLRRLPHEVVESELFGYARGGFFSRREVEPGVVSNAGSGTCIIRGLDMLPAATQERCLPWLLEGHIQPAGSDTSVQSHARIILEVQASDLLRQRDTTFIPPVYKLIEQNMIFVESLQKRKQDVLPIALHYLSRYSQEWALPARRIDAAAERLLKRAQWRDNVRGVMSAMSHAVRESCDDVLEVKHFPAVLAGRSDVVADVGLDAAAIEDLVEQKLEQFFARLGSYEVRDLYATILSKIERPLFRLVLKQTAGNQVRAARILGLNRNTLRTRLKKLGLTDDVKGAA